MNKKIRRLIGTIVVIALFAGGYFLLEGLSKSKPPKPNPIIVDDYNERFKIYETKLKAWENYSPQSLSLGAQTEEIKGAYFFDIDKGRAATARNNQQDIYWGTGVDFIEFLRAENGISWVDVGVANFNKINYRQIRDAKYSSPKHVKSNRFDLFNARRNVAPSKNHVYFVKTSNGNVAKIQIIDYLSPSKNIKSPRSLKIKYEVFPIVQGPQKPVKPTK